MLAAVLITLALADDCTVLHDDAEAPSPSLVKCYRHNTLACCVSAHDQYISDTYETLFSTQCQREYTDMEDYFCLACNPLQPDYVQDDTLYICKDFAERLWGGDLNKPSGDYDNCGMFPYWDDSENAPVMPSAYFEDAYAFFESVKPPFFEGFTITIVDDDDDCFNHGVLLGAIAVYLFV